MIIISIKGSNSPSLPPKQSDEKKKKKQLTQRKNFGKESPSAALLSLERRPQRNRAVRTDEEERTRNLSLSLSLSASQPTTRKVNPQRYFSRNHARAGARVR